MKNKVINILGFIVGLLGLLFGIYSYLNNQKKSEISYNVYSPSFKIFDSELTKGMSSVNLFVGDSIILNENVYLTTFSIWNSGDLPIMKNNIRKKLDVEFEGMTWILDIKTIKEVERGISNIKLSAISHLRYNLDWDYFDPNNGLRIQIMYTGAEKVKCKVNGYIFGTNIKESIPIQYDKNHPVERFLLYSSVFTILFLLYTILITYKFRSKFVNRLFRPIIFISSVFILGCLYLIYYYYTMVSNTPF